LQQQTKALQKERPETGAEVSKQLESVKHLLWHGNTEEALERLSGLLVELSVIQARSNAAKKVSESLSEFETYICNNREFIPNFGERRRQGETISTAFVESTINQVVSRRFVQAADAMDPTGRPSFAADQDEGPQRGFGRPIPPLVSKIQAATTDSGARSKGGLTPDFLALSLTPTDASPFLKKLLSSR
jgi:hypothetical protein